MNKSGLNLQPEPIIKKRKWYSQCFREKWLHEPELKDWLRQDITNEKSSFCIVCKVQLKNANKSMLLKHNNTQKHQNKLQINESGVNTDCSIKKRNMRKFSDIADNFCSKLELNDAEIFGSSEEIDQDLTHLQNESLLNKCLSPPKRLMKRSPGIERKTLDDAIGNFYKAINSSTEESVSNSNFEDSDEAFGRYLGKELKNIKNIYIKKKLKLKIMNMVLNTDDSAGNNSSRPFPIFVSTLANIEFPKVIHKPPECSDEA